MYYNRIYNIEHITAFGAGDKQIGFCRSGRSFKASKDARIILRGFFTFRWQGNSLMNCGLFGFFAERLSNIPDQISRFKKSFRDSLRVDKRINTKSRRCLILTTYAMTMVAIQRVMTFIASCEQFKYSIRFDSWNETNKYPNLLHGG